MDRCKTLLKSQKFVYFLLFLLSILLACAAKDYDYDLFARLIVGKHFFETGWISYQDFLSYTPTHLWYDHEWGASVIFYFFFKCLGNCGLILIQALTMFFTTFFVIKTPQLQKHSYPTLLLPSSIFLLMFLHLNPTIVRCHMFSFMFFAILLYILEKTRKSNSNLIWFTPLLFVLWNNIHGGVVSGIGIVFIYMICEFIQRKKWRQFLYVFVISLPLLAINPYGADYLNFLFSANTKNRSFITEWWFVFAKRHVVYYYPAFCLGIFTSVVAFYNLVRNKNFDLTKLVLLLVTTVLGLMHVKLLSLSLIVVFSLFYNDIIRLFNRQYLRFWESLSYYALIISSIFLILTVEPYTPKVNFLRFPTKEVEFIKLNNIKGNLVTSFGLGSYVSYKLYPQNLIYMDGRYEEVYYDREFENLVNFENLNENWKDLLKLYPNEIIMFDKKAPANEFLMKDNNWNLIYVGPLCSIFVKSNSAKKNYIEPSNNITYYERTFFERSEGV
jgi:hypothetical protein